jgi:hypothetical protein
MGVPPRIARFTGHTDELDRSDAILMRKRPAAVTQASLGGAAVHGMGGSTMLCPGPMEVSKFKE